MAFAIELEKVTVGFGSDTILQDISLAIPDQHTLVIIGPSGQGKTVLMKTMAGLITPKMGKVVVKGCNWAHSSQSQRTQILSKVGMLFQKNALFDSLTCGENIAFPLAEKVRLHTSEIQKKVEYFLDAVGILHAKDLYPDEISGGMQKRLGIARALALNPEIIFYDDPTAGLDPITSKKIIELIIELRKINKSTVVAITNDMNRAFQMADSIVMVTGKEVIQAGTPSQTKRNQDPRVRQFILGQIKGPLTVME